MDDLNAFERQLEREVHRAFGPPRPVDVAAIVRTATTRSTPSTWSPQRSRWLTLPIPYRRTQTPTATDTTEYQPTPIPATNGHTPTVIGRTQSMLSPAKAITAGAVVFAIGGVMLVAQPFQQQGSVPGAETETGWAENTPFTLKFVWYDRNVRDGEAVTEGGITKVLGSCNAMGIADPSDPRLDGSLTWCTDEHDYGAVRDDSTVVWTDTYRIVNDEGAWQGSISGAQWEDPVSGERMEPGGDPIILVGEGAYEGLYAALTFMDEWDGHGVIFEGAPPADPVPPTDE